MCVGIPMQVCGAEAFGFAPCRRARGDAPVEQVDLRLVADACEGSWVLVFNGAARRTLDAEEARQIDAALAALQIALDGDTDPGADPHADRVRIDALFADLVDREPQLPAHLRGRH